MNDPSMDNVTNDIQGSNPDVPVQGSNPDEGSNPTHGSNLAIFQGSNPEEGSNPFENHGSNHDSISQSRNSVEGEDESSNSRNPDDLGSRIEAVDSEIFIRRSVKHDQNKHKSNASMLDSTTDSIVLTLDQWEQLNKHRLKDVSSLVQGNHDGLVAINHHPAANEKSQTSTSSLGEIRTQKVSEHRRVKTPDSVIKAIKENCVHLGTGKRRQLENMYVQLNSTNLLTLLLGQRTQPVVYSLSDTGYTPQRLLLKSKQVKSTTDTISPSLDMSLSTSTFSETDKPEFVTIEEDDIFLYHYE